MKTRIAYVSYADCNVTQYQLKMKLKSTELLFGSTFNGPYIGKRAAKVTEVLDGEGGLEIQTEKSKIRLNAFEVECLLVVLLAHQRDQEGFDLQLYKKD